MTELTDTNAQSLEELFDKDPLHLTDSDVEAICKAQREQRKRWQAEEDAARREGRKPRPAAANITTDMLDIKVD